MFDAIEKMGREAHASHQRRGHLVTVPKGRKGPWRVAAFKPRVDLRYLRFWRDGRAPGVGTFTKLVHRDRGVVMSDTVPEIHDALKHLDKLRGRVLITGLGLGMVPNMLMQLRPRSLIKSITIVEIDPDVVHLTGRHYMKADRRIRIVTANAFEWVPPAGTKFDCAWHDIWDSGGLNGGDKRKLARHYAKYVPKGMQFYWG